MKQEKFDRMENLSDWDALIKLDEGIEVISKNLLEDEFSIEDIFEYFHCRVQLCIDSINEPEFDSAGFSITDRFGDEDDDEWGDDQGLESEPDDEWFEDDEEESHHCDDLDCNCSI
jgi:hypothetical protein